MPSYEVTNATADGADPDRRIDMIGGPANGGWKMREDDAIRAINSGATSFYVEKPRNIFATETLGGLFSLGNRVEIQVRKRWMAGLEYLQTVADGVETNNLRSLPPCPPAYRLVKQLP